MTKRSNNPENQVTDAVLLDKIADAERASLVAEEEVDRIKDLLKKAKIVLDTAIFHERSLCRQLLPEEERPLFDGQEEDEES